MITQKDIHDLLRSLGIKNDSVVVVHTSMRALGEVEGGCDGLIDAFTSYLSEGLFIVPTHTWANVGPGNPVYDVSATVPCIGALPTVAAFRKDGVRSLHPTHSVAAFGKNAAEFVSGEENSTSPCPPEGVWARLYDAKATILLLGVTHNRNTYIHAVDEMIGLKGRLAPPIPLVSRDKDGNEYAVLLRRHSGVSSAYFDNYAKPLEYLGAVKTASLGNADVIAADAVRTAEVIRALWEKADYDLVAERKDIPEEYYI